MKKILIAVDFSDVTGKVVNAGVELAKAFNADVCIMHTEPPLDGYIFYDADYSSMGTFGYMREFDPVMEEYHQEKVSSDKHSLETLKSAVTDKGVNAKTLLIEGDVVKSLLNEACKYDYIVIGSHRHCKLYKLLFDDVGMHLLNKATCPVLIVPTDDE